MNNTSTTNTCKTKPTKSNQSQTVFLVSSRLTQSRQQPNLGRDGVRQPIVAEIDLCESIPDASNHIPLALGTVRQPAILVGPLVPSRGVV